MGNNLLTRAGSDLSAKVGVVFGFGNSFFSRRRSRPLGEPSVVKYIIWWFGRYWFLTMRLTVELGVPYKLYDVSISPLGSNG